MRLRTELIEPIRSEVEGWSSRPVHASLFEITPKGLKAALRRGEPIIASLRETSIVLAGPDIATLLSDRRKRIIV